MTSAVLSPVTSAGAASTGGGRGDASARLWWFAAATLVLAHATLAWLTRQPALTTGGDDSIYVLLARALRTGRYVDLFYVGTPFHSQYPPGYPALLALVTSVAGEHLDVMLALNVVASCVGLLLLYDTVRRLWRSSWISLSVLAVAALNPRLIHSAGTVMTEPVFFCLFMSVLSLAARPTPTRRTLLTAGVLAVLTALTRSVGVTVVGGLWLVWVSQRRWRAAVLLAIGASLTLGPWLTWTMRAPIRDPDRSYARDAAGSLETRGVLRLLQYRVARNAADYGVRELPVTLPLPTIPGTPIDNAVWSLVLVVTLAFGGAAVWRRWPVAAVCLGCYGGLLLVWVWVLERFLLPITPLLLLAVLLGACAVGRLVGRRAAVAFPLAVCLSILGTALTEDVRGLSIASGCDRAAPTRSTGCFNADQLSLFAAARYAAVHTPPGATFVTGSKEPVLYYYSGRQSVPETIAGSGTAHDQLTRFAAAGATYILLGHTHVDDNPFSRLLQDGCSELHLVAAFPPRTYLFSLALNGPPEPEGAACRVLADYRSNSATWYPIRYW